MYGKGATAEISHGTSDGQEQKPIQHTVPEAHRSKS